MQLGLSSFHGTQLQSTCTARRSPSIAFNVIALQPIQGKVISTQMGKTAVVQVDRYVPHKLYGKRVRVTKKFFAHDEEDSCTVGDVVEMTSIPPKSKKKTFMISKIVTKSDF